MLNRNADTKASCLSFHFISRWCSYKWFPSARLCMVCPFPPFRVLMLKDRFCECEQDTINSFLIQIDSLCLLIREFSSHTFNIITGIWFKSVLYALFSICLISSFFFLFLGGCLLMEYFLLCNLLLLLYMYKLYISYINIYSIL